MLYTLEELAERCQVTLEFIQTVQREGSRFEPCATITRLMEDPIELYDSFDALMLLWIKAFVDHGWSFLDARHYAESLVDRYFGDAQEENYPWDTESPPSDTLAAEMDVGGADEQDE